MHIGIRANEALVEELKAVTLLMQRTTTSTAGKVTRSQVCRYALAEGLKVLRRRTGVADSERQQ